MSNNQNSGAEEVFNAVMELIAELPVKRHKDGCSCGAIRKFPTPPAEMAAEIGSRAVAFRAQDACEGIHSSRACFYPTRDTANGRGNSANGWWFDIEGVCRQTTDLPATMAKVFPEGPNEVAIVVAADGINNISKGV